MPARALLEICVESADGARAAARGGADRLELCADLACGGLTAPPGLLAEVQTASALPVVTLLRPRAGDFVYSPAELATLREQAAAARRAGAAAVALGALAPGGGFDLPALAELVRAARPLPVVCHRCFDELPDPHEALEQLVALGFVRVLTAGGRGTAAQNAARLAALVRQAAGRITVMPGGGVRAAGAAALRRTTGATEFHSAARRAGATETDGSEVAALRAALDG
ncbi:MAG TPA: copper homeostasis protein CutC [Planctomycetota bacterium]|nr:copper homeostasis protein CutC [Planctomycetota bacterium]